MTYYYDSQSGSFGYYNNSTVNTAYTGQPRYASRYVNALAKYNFNAGVPMGNSSNQEKTMAMGNTLNAALMLVNNPLDGIFRNNNNLHPQTQNRLAKSAGEGESFGLWITPSASFRSVDGDYSQGYGGFDVNSYGVTIGVDKWLNEQFRLGLFAGLNTSELDGDDFQLGVYGQAFLPQGFQLNLGLAYSWQNYDASRYVYNTRNPLLNQRITSDFDAGTFMAALELNKTFTFSNDMFLRPGIGYTYMGTTIDAYSETSSNLGNRWDLSQRVDETDFDLHLFRAGTDIGWATENAAVTARLYYVGNAGDDQPEGSARFINNINGPGFNIYGAEYDDSMANLGLSAKFVPGENSHFAIDYDALLGSDSTTHNVNLTFNYSW